LWDFDAKKLTVVFHEPENITCIHIKVNKLARPKEKRDKKKTTRDFV